MFFFNFGVRIHVQSILGLDIGATNEYSGSADAERPEQHCRCIIFVQKYLEKTANIRRGNPETVTIHGRVATSQKAPPNVGRHLNLNLWLDFLGSCSKQVSTVRNCSEPRRHLSDQRWTRAITPSPLFLFHLEPGKLSAAKAVFFFKYWGFLRAEATPGI